MQEKLITLFALISLSTAAVVPIDSSSVTVKRSGHDYSYSINENRGVAIDPLPHQPIPVIKYVPEGTEAKHQEHVEVKHHEEIKPLPTQINGNQISAGMAYTAVPITYTYLPAHQYAIPYPYGINYPYNLIASF